MRTAPRTSRNATGLAPAGLYFQRIAHNLRDAEAHDTKALRPRAPNARRHAELSPLT